MKKFSFIMFFIVMTLSIKAQSKYQWETATGNGYSYRYVTNDPMQTRFYTLKNGLSVILSKNTKEPRVAVRIAVRAGSNNDPKDHTGLAHYLEHLLFKGTDKYGSLDWAKEKPYLDKIEILYEQYGLTKETAKRKALYHQIDSLSGIASKYAIAGEYNKLMKDLGSQGTNAHTWVEETVYEEEIPANAMDKFLTIQAERFRNPIFRIFHTELEAVYEEKNRGLDNDRNKMQEAMMYNLFPTHNYGQQTTIGTIEHLKNPSLVAIRNYYNTYYVPNNMAVIMSGDFNPDELIKKIDKQFSYMKAKPVTLYNPAPEKPILKPIVKEVYGPSAENFRFCYRTPAANTREALVLDLISSILNNGKAGLLDLNINKQQKIQGSYAGMQQYKDYGLFIVGGSPKQGQTLEQAKDLLFEQIEKLKKGDFDESLIKAIALNNKLEILRGLESSANRVENLMAAFIKNRGDNWDKNVSESDEQAKMTKAEIVAVANKYFGENYVLLYKRKGEDKNIEKVEKPAITPIETNEGKQSAFVKKIISTPVADIKPVWLNFDKDMSKSQVGIAPVLYVQNKENDLFRIKYRFDMGSWNNKLLPLAASYLQYLSSDKYTAEQISTNFYNIACNFNVQVGTEDAVITISGLQENFEKAVSLFEHLIKNCKENDEALQSLKASLLKSRANNKLNKNAIMQGLITYATYGSKNPFNTTLSDKEINEIKSSDLVNLLHSLLDYKHTIIYYGPDTLNQFTTEIAHLHKLPQRFTENPEKIDFSKISQNDNQVLFANYDMVQSEIQWVRNSTPYDPAMETTVDMFNNYFGNGMTSLVFKTIRESKALAYSTYAYYGIPNKKDDLCSMVAYVGCQADKMNEAIKGMNELLDELPFSQEGFNVVKTSIKKDLQTSRITQDDIIFTAIAAEKKGINYDIRQKSYDELDKLSFDDLKKLHQQQIAKKAYTYCIVGSDSKINLDDLKKIGEVKKLSLEEIFGY